MAFRRFLRGQVSRERLEAVGNEIADRYGEPTARIECLDADNWLSAPLVVNDRWFVKVISSQHSLVHALLTTGRNLGAFSSGTEGFFEHFGTPLEMAEHELQATRRMRELGVNAPSPVEAFEYDGLGVLVLEYLPAFRSLDELEPEVIRGFAPDLFGALATMHGAGLAHGDLRGENVLVASVGPETSVGDPSTSRETDMTGGGKWNEEGKAARGEEEVEDEEELYFIDATRVRENAIADARSYDLACAMGALEPKLGASVVVESALEAYPVEHLLDAREFLDFVNMRPDHGFDATSVKGEIEKAAT